jgi:hypothetical protein
MATRPGPLGDEENWFDRNGGPAEREFAFETSEERLPWLESDEEGEESPVYDTGRLVGLGLIMLVALVVLVGGVWFFANRGAVSGPAPDGSLIPAPETPYKERPASPGGKTFAGTGDTSYAVGEGREVEARLADAPPQLVVPSAIATPSPSAAPTASEKPAAPPPAPSALPAGTAVQVGAYSSRADAEAGWRRLTGQTDVLSGVAYRIVAGRADIGTVYRLQAAGGDKAGAQALCGRLKAAGIACQVK